MRIGIITLMTLCAVAASGCQSAARHYESLPSTQERQTTVGTVQREIRVGMSGAEVARVLGSPNIVSTDEQRREVWIYDKISTDKAYSTSAGGISALILGGALVGDGLVGGSASPYYGSSAGARSTTQRTLTIIIKFDEDQKVRDFAYYTSRF